MKAFLIPTRGDSRLKSLTLNKPSVLLEFMNVPMLKFLASQISLIPVDELILVDNWPEDEDREQALEILKAYNLKVDFLEPSGTFGMSLGLELIQSKLSKEDEKFLVLESEIVCDYPLKDLLGDTELAPGALVTALATTEPKTNLVSHNRSLSGVNPSFNSSDDCIFHSLDGKSYRYTGVYLFKSKVFEALSVRNKKVKIQTAVASLTEDRLVNIIYVEKPLVDLSTVEGYIQSMDDYIARCPPEILEITPKINDPKDVVLIHSSSVIGKFSQIGPRVIIGPNVKIGDHSRIKNSIILKGAEVDEYSYIENTILGWNSKVGKWVRICGKNSVIGTSVSIKNEVYVDSCVIFPHKEIKMNYVEKGIIL